MEVTKESNFCEAKHHRLESLHDRFVTEHQRRALSEDTERVREKHIYEKQHARTHKASVQAVALRTSIPLSRYDV